MLNGCFFNFPVAFALLVSVPNEAQGKMGIFVIHQEEKYGGNWLKIERMIDIRIQQ